MPKNRIARTRIAKIRYKNGFTIHRFHDHNEPPAGHPKIEDLIGWAEHHADVIPSKEVVHGYAVIMWSDDNVYAHVEEDGRIPLPMLPALIDSCLRTLTNDIMLNTKSGEEYDDGA